MVECSFKYKVEHHATILNSLNHKQISVAENLTKKEKGIKTCHMKSLFHSFLLVAQNYSSKVSFEYHLNIRAYSTNGEFGNITQLKKCIISKWWQI